MCCEEGTSYLHSCQTLLGVNLSSEFVNLYFPYAGQGLFLLLSFSFFAGGRGILNSNWHVWQNTHARLHISLLMRFLIYCTRPVSVHLAMACVG